MNLNLICNLDHAGCGIPMHSRSAITLELLRPLQRAAKEVSVILV